MTDEIQTVRETSHRGHSITIERHVGYRDSPRYPNEFVLLIDGETVTTATNLENRGWGGPGWTNILNQYAAAYIDGIEN